MFKIDYDDCQSYEILPEGEYEVIIQDVKVAQTMQGKEHIQFVLKIRDDVAGQKYGGRLIFHKVWKRKDSGQYPTTEFNSIGKACKLLNGKEYSSMEQLFNDYKNRNCKVKIKHTEYNGNTYETISKWEVSNLDAPFGTFPQQELPF